uniref:Glutamate receptor n=1 Tax=Branchiostoma floridae TaxID=7739 RepID=C3Y1C0_BRAFL|eukprot:XP_002609650.1 hypothetical protein BRAFLDRAFT_83648 [Branchiostoma floridae]
MKLDVFHHSQPSFIRLTFRRFAAGWEYGGSRCKQTVPCSYGTPAGGVLITESSKLVTALMLQPGKARYPVLGAEKPDDIKMLLPVPIVNPFIIICQLIDMRNGTLRVVTILEAPFTMKEKTADGSYKYTGFCVDMINELSRMLKFDYDLYEVPDRTYGAMTDDGEWSGMVGQLVNDKADIALAAFTITSERERYVDFTERYMDYGIGFLMKRLVAADTVSMRLPSWLIDSPSFPLRVDIPTSLHSGVEPAPRSLPVRIMAGTWWLFGLIVISTYTANLTAFLTVKRLEQPIRSIDDLAKQTEIAYGIPTGGGLYSFFRSQQGTGTIYELMWNYMNTEPTTFVKGLTGGVERVRQKADIALAAFTITSERERYVDFTERYMDYGIGFLMKRLVAADTVSMRLPSWPMDSPSFPLRVDIPTSLHAGSRLHLALYIVPLSLSRTRPLWCCMLSIIHICSCVVLICIRGFPQCSVEPAPRSLPVRIMAGTWWLFGLIVISTYTANLTAFLTVKRLEQPIRSIDDLAKQTEIAYGIPTGGGLYSFFRSQQGTGTIYELMWNYMNTEPTTFVKGLTGGVERVRQGNFVFMYDAPILEYRVNTDTSCQLMLLPNTFRPQGYGLATRSDSGLQEGLSFGYVALGEFLFMYDTPMLEYLIKKDPNCELMMVGKPFRQLGYGLATQTSNRLSHEISLGILHLKENGKITELRDRWWPKVGCSMDGSESEAAAEGLALDSFVGVYIVVAVGGALAMVAALAEVSWHSYCNNRPNVPTQQEDTNNTVSEQRKLTEEVLRGIDNGTLQILIRKTPPVIDTCPAHNGGPPDIKSDGKFV